MRLVPPGAMPQEPWSKRFLNIRFVSPSKANLATVSRSRRMWRRPVRVIRNLPSQGPLRRAAGRTRRQSLYAGRLPTKGVDIMLEAPYRGAHYDFHVTVLGRATMADDWNVPMAACPG